MARPAKKPQEKVLRTTVCMYPHQRDKLAKLGGSAWMQAQIDAAPLPRAAQPTRTTRSKA